MISRLVRRPRAGYIDERIGCLTGHSWHHYLMLPISLKVIMGKKKLSEKKARLLKTKGTKLVRKSKADRYPLSNEKLEVLGAKYKPAPSWYEEEELT